MKHAFIALTLALTMLSWGQTKSNSKPAEAGSPDSAAKAGCCQNMADMKDGSCCAHKSAADGQSMSCCSGKDMSCCSGKDGKACMKDSKDQTAQAGCCNGDHAKGCCTGESGDKAGMACCNGGQCGAKHDHAAHGAAGDVSVK